MPRPRRLLLIAAACTAVAACGEAGIQISSSDTADHAAAVIFVQHCSGCHTLGVAGTQGSATNVRTREYKDGPNFDQRTETKNCVLYAIRNGGFSSGPMPQNIVTGPEAEALANFVSKYSKKPTSSGGPSVKVPDCPAG